MIVHIPQRDYPEAGRHGHGKSPMPFNLMHQRIVLRRGKDKIKNRLIRDLGPNDWDLPPHSKAS
jgi:hypothetical protein